MSDEKIREAHEAIAASKSLTLEEAVEVLAKAHKPADDRNTLEGFRRSAALFERIYGKKRAPE